MPRASLAIAKHELRILRRDPSSVALLLVTPLVLAIFTLPIYRVALLAQGYRTANGSEQAIPGMATMFGVFILQFLGLAFFRDHGWGMWVRLRASQAAISEILLGKVVVTLAMVGLQQAGILTAGVLLLGLRIRGSLLALALIVAAFSICLVAFSLATISICSSMQQLATASLLSSLLFAGVGGAIVPLTLMPWWTSLAGAITPVYWAMRGYEAAILQGAGVGAVIVPTGALLLQTLVFLAVAVLRFRIDETKRSW